MARKTTRPSFSWRGIPLERAEALLHAAYITEVEYRRMAYEPDRYVAENVHRLAAFLTGEARKFGVMLCGVSGNGKTTLLYAFQNALGWLNDNFRTLRPYDKGLYVVDAVEFAGLCRDEGKYRELRELPLLALEDVGREAEQVKVYGDPITPVVDVIEYRYNRQLFTFITTNLTPRQLAAKYGRRVADRFNEMEVIIFNKPDSYRRKRAETPSDGPALPE